MTVHAQPVSVAGVGALALEMLTADELRALLHTLEG